MDSENTIDIVSIKALNAAWRKFSRGKSARPDIAAFRKDLRGSLSALSISLADGSYQHQAYQSFVICDPKRRLIHKATVRDRVVHQALVNALQPDFESRFIYDSYSCRVDKGTHFGVRRVTNFLRCASRNNTRKVYALKCDVRTYFASIDHDRLLELVARRVEDDAALELVRTVVLSHGAERGRGLPLGNVTSQLFANIYLHELDWFIKQTVGVRYYGRYCDDFIVVSADKAYLQALIGPIRAFLYDSLHLDLHPSKVTIRAWDQGIDFLGYVLRPHSVSLRTKTSRRMLARVNERNVSSYLGLCAHADAYEVSQVVRLVAWQRRESQGLDAQRCRPTTEGVSDRTIAGW